MKIFDRRFLGFAQIFFLLEWIGALVALSLNMDGQDRQDFRIEYLGHDGCLC